MKHPKKQRTFSEILCIAVAQDCTYAKQNNLVYRYVGIVQYTQSKFAIQSKALGLWEFCDGGVYKHRAVFY